MMANNVKTLKPDPTMTTPTAKSNRGAATDIAITRMGGAVRANRAAAGNHAAIDQL
jgi:hypothetical protein